MSLRFLMKWFTGRKSSARKLAANSGSRSLRFESLEDRQLLSATTIAFQPEPIPFQDAPLMPVNSDPILQPALSTPPATRDLGEFYWHMAEKIPLLRLADDILVKLLPGTDKQSVLGSLTRDSGLTAKASDVVSLDANTLILSRTTIKDDAADVYSELKDFTLSMPGVAWAAPVFIGADSGAGVYLLDEIGVALRRDVDPQEFFAKGFTSWYRFFDNQYIATVETGGGMAALELANKLSEDPRVEWATPNFQTDFRVDFTPNDTFYSNQWTLNNTGQTGAKNDADADLPAAWDIERGLGPYTAPSEPQIVVAVLDNGVQTNHPDLSIFVNPGEIAGNGIDDDGNGFIDDVNGWDFAGAFGVNIPDNNPNPETPNDNHGTAVAGAVGAVGNNSVGVSGTAPNVKILPVKIARDDTGGGGGFVNFDTVAKAVYYAAGIIVNGAGNPTGATWDAADILVNSWGGGSSNSMLTAAFDYIQTHGRNGRGVPSFNASGNGASGTVTGLRYQKVEIPVTGGAGVTKQYVWSFQTNGDSTFSGESRAWITDITLPTGTHELLDTDNSLAGWTSSTWTIADDPSHSYGTARYVARSAQLLTANQQSNLLSPLINVTANGTISFARYVSSQYTSSTVYDPLVLFEITNNGTPVAIWADAGNPLPNLNVSYPANLASTIAVGASTDWDYRAAYSQFGTTLDFVAPSSGGYGSVYTTDRTGEAGYNQTGTGETTGADPLSNIAYTSTFSGTSAATPYAAGIAAIMLSKNYSLTAGEVRSIMRGTSDKIGGNNGATAYVAGFNQYYGYGRVNAAAALAATKWAGDYNSNNAVDAADYAIWRNLVGQSVLMSNDITPGTVTNTDYEIWRMNFGNTNSGSSGSAAFVPGDYNQDGTVGESDYSVWAADFGSTTVLDADGNFNGVVDLADLVVWREMRNVTTDEVIPGDFNGDGIVDMADYDLWEAEDPLADADLDSDVDEDDLEFWSDHWGLTNAGVYPATLVGDPPLRVADTAPRVTGVRLSGSNSTHDPYDFDGTLGSGEQLRTVPVGGLDTIEISFSEEVYVTANALALYGMNFSSVPSLLSFSYDVGTQTATWIFDDPLPADQYLIRLSDSIYDLDHDALDGEFTNPWSLAEASGYASTFPSGNGEAGGEFRFRFSALSADFTGDNVVDGDDYNIWDQNQYLTSGASQTDGDTDGDGDVDLDDEGQLGYQENLNFANWPSVEPGMILVSTETDESDANYSFGDLSLREALAIAAAQSGTDTIVFAPGVEEILLSLGQLTVGSNVTIAGPGMDDLTIDAQGNSRVFKVNSGVTATITGLTMTEGSSGAGGAVYMEGNLTLDSVRVENSVSTGYGGGIYAVGSLTLDSSVVVGNDAAGAGGGIYVEWTTPLVAIIDSTIDSNEASLGGGIFGYLNTGERLIVENSTISNNHATDAGGGVGIWNYSSSAPCIATFINTTISNNTAPWNGGLRVYGSQAHADLINSTVAYNQGDGSGGIALILSGTATLHNTIVAENKNAAGTTNSNLSYGNVNSSSSYNLIGPGGSGGLSNGTNGNIVLMSGSAGLTTLGDYGGPTWTHALLDGSPAIDAGENSKVAAYELLYDQRGSDRIDDGDGDLLLLADIGAFELAADEYFGTV